MVERSESIALIRTGEELMMINLKTPEVLKLIDLTTVNIYNLGNQAMNLKTA